MAPCRKYIHIQAPTAVMNKDTGIQGANANGTLVPSPQQQLWSRDGRGHRKALVRVPTQET
jgi:hypothetical protein